MASIEPTKFTVNAKGKKVATRDSKWVARWRSPDGKSREKTFGRQEDAKQWLTGVEHSKLTGAYVDPRAGKVMFKTYAEGWRQGRLSHRPGTVEQIERYLRLHVYPAIGERPIGAIRPSEVQGLVKRMSASLAPTSVEVGYTWVATIFKAAVTDQVIPRSPCVNISLPVVHQEKVHPLPLEVVEKLVEAVPHRYRALVVLGAGTGVRISEALGLSNDRIDWIRREVTIDRQLARVEKGTPHFGPVKDKRNRPRTIPLPQVVVDALAAHVAAFGLGPDGLLFTAPRGGAIHTANFSTMWREAAGPLGIPLGDGYHQLRHFYASLLIQGGVSVKVVQERLGHTSAQMTLDIYAHLWPEDDDRTRAAVDSVLAPAPCGDSVGAEAL